MAKQCAGLTLFNHLVFCWNNTLFRVVFRLLTVWLSANLVVARESVLFNRDVRPILSENCFECHGPDASKRRADLRLDTGASGQATITAGNPSGSELFKRITHADPEERMPSVDSGRVLAPSDIDTLRTWILQGAKWGKHWAFIPPGQPAIPLAKNSTWPSGAIYRFVLARLQRAGLQPSPRADKETLLRRVSFDLTGLPPNLRELDAFLADTSPRAFEKVVDRLLTSPRHGERMALDWLDAARYADSHGYSLDRRRVMWPWRDWVIRAFNENMPFDQFALEQLAGDLLPNATIDQRVATGFNRNHAIQSEGGVIDEEYRVETVVDRVETTSAVFLGLTFGCARCHDHKYDPISQREFYEFYAFFNNVPETAHVGNADKLADKPFLKAPSVLQRLQIVEFRKQIAHLQKEVDEEHKSGELSELVWIDDELPAGVESLGNGGGSTKFEFVSKTEHPVFSGKHSSRRSSKGRGQHLIQNAKHGLLVTDQTKLFSYVYLDANNPPKQIMLQWNDGNSWAHRAYWGEEKIGWGKENTPSLRKIGPLPEPGQWARLEVDAKTVGLVAEAKITGWAFTQFDGTVYWDKSGTVERNKAVSENRLTAVRASLAELEGKLPTTMIMGQKEPPRKTFVLTRGQYDQPGKVQVGAALPAALGQWPKGAPRNRLGLARWLTGAGNPLTARVTVNRLWQMYFGTGIVKSSEDFGAQGEWPTHPELLDWLATEFMRTGWNLKVMHKLIVMSATYQQASRVTPPLLEADPANRLFARGPRFRLPAEMIRDHALSSGGLLVGRLGGESVRPYQPPGLWDDVVYENVPRFVQDHGEKLYRRSLYTYWKRSVPPPNMQAFDAPSREVCVLTRAKTNTPLAALVLMNDPTFVEASRQLASRVLRDGGATAESRLTLLHRLVYGRRPTERELDLLRDALAELRTSFRAEPEAARRLLAVGESPLDELLAAAELATYTSLANAVLGTDEAITRN